MTDIAYLLGQMKGTVGYQLGAHEAHDELQRAVYAWLGVCRDRMRPEDVESLQSVLGPLSTGDSEQ